MIKILSHTFVMVSFCVLFMAGYSLSAQTYIAHINDSWINLFYAGFLFTPSNLVCIGICSSYLGALWSPTEYTLGQHWRRAMAFGFGAFLAIMAPLAVTDKSLIFHGDPDTYAGIGLAILAIAFPAGFDPTKVVPMMKGEMK